LLSVLLSVLLACVFAHCTREGERERGREGERERGREGERERGREGERERGREGEREQESDSTSNNHDDTKLRRFRFTRANSLALVVDWVREDEYVLELARLYTILK